jgi:hypothetical protein
MGELRWNDGSYYKGEVKNGKMHGTGHFVDGNITYAGINPFISSIFSIFVIFCCRY